LYAFSLFAVLYKFNLRESGKSIGVSAVNFKFPLTNLLGMPISDDEFNKGQKYVGLAKEILDFLCENKRKAYFIDELTENLRPSIISKNTLIYALHRQTFQLVLDDLVKNDMIIARFVDREVYYKCK
jgi:DNA-binding transcriptional ArsR family regulator